MAFRIIREHSEDFERLLRERKKSALAEETKRWSNLTALSAEDIASFLNRFASRRDASNFNQALEKATLEIEAQIHKGSANIAKIQGNMEISRVSALLDKT